MKKLRAPWWILLWFGLITLGQAYPYSYAWSFAKHECSCNEAGRECIHGCDPRKKKAPKPCHDHDGLLQEKDTEGPQWVSPSCSKAHQKKILSFQGDPFLPAQAILAYLPSPQTLGFQPTPSDVSFPCDPDPPPPKDDE